MEMLEWRMFWVTRGAALSAYPRFGREHLAMGAILFL